MRLLITNFLARKWRVLAQAQSAARLGHRGALQAGISRRDRQAAVVGRRLVSQALHGARHDRASSSTWTWTARWPTPPSGSTAVRRRLALRLRVLAARSDALSQAGADNVLAIRLDNPPDSSRWYPGGGIYRNVWLVKTAPVHVATGAPTSPRPRSRRSARRENLKVNRG
jgi:hypothetical protein